MGAKRSWTGSPGAPRVAGSGLQKQDSAVDHRLLRAASRRPFGACWAKSRGALQGAAVVLGTNWYTLILHRASQDRAAPFRGPPSILFILKGGTIFAKKKWLCVVLDI